MSILEAVEELLAHHFKPQRTIYISFGHDEEIMGVNGAKNIANHFRKEGITFEFISDEGLMITEPPLFPGLSRGVAVIAISEKGFVNVELSVSAAAGHSSFPPSHTAIGVISAAVAKLEENPHPPSLYGVAPMLDAVGRECSFFFRALFANLWLFKIPLMKVFEKQRMLNAVIRTTTAVTMISGGIKDNVLPSSATAIVNHRIALHQTVEDVLEYDRKIINNPNVTLRVTISLPPSPISDVNSFGFKLMEHTILQIFPDVFVAPGQMIANTDTRHFWDLSPNIFRFLPNYVNIEESNRFHGRDERISVKNYANAVEYYYHLIRNSDLKHFS